MAGTSDICASIMILTIDGRVVGLSTLRIFSYPPDGSIQSRSPLRTEERRKMKVGNPKLYQGNSEDDLSIVR